MDEFADYLAELEQRAQAEFAAERAIEVAERSRSAYAEVDLLGRLLASTGRSLRVVLSHDGPVQGVVLAAGEGWCTLADGRSRVWLATRHIVSVTGLAPTAVAPPARSVTAKLSLRSALQSVASEGVPVRCVTADGGVVTGDVGRVGADFVELQIDDVVVAIRLDQLVTVRPRS